MKELIIMNIYLIAFVIMLIINLVYVNKKIKHLDSVESFRTELLDTKNEAIDRMRTTIQNIECEKCFNKNKLKTIRVDNSGFFTNLFKKCKYATENNDFICLAKDKQYFIDKLNIEQKDEREAVLGNEA